MLRISVITVLCIALSSCGTVKVGGEPAVKLEFVAFARYVTQTNSFPTFWKYMRAIAEGSFVYDDIVRRPDVPAGPLEISCSETQRIGAMILLTGRTARVSESRYPRKIHLSRVSIKYSWTHSGRNKAGERFKSRVRPLSNGIISDGLTLTKRDRVNGVITLTATHFGEVIHTTSFELNDCGSDT